MPQPVYPGLEVQLGGRTFVVPPLSLGQLQRFQTHLQEIDQGHMLQSAGVFLPVIHAALSRNYPDLTIDEVGELLDIGNMLEVFNAVMDVSGARRKDAEAKKAPAATPSTGTDSPVT